MNGYTPNSVVHRLAELSRMLDEATEEIGVLDEEAVRAKSRYQVAYADAYLRHSGPQPQRKEFATRRCADELLAYDLAAAKSRACLERIRTLRVQIEIGRSLNAAVRSEWAATGASQPT